MDVSHRVRFEFEPLRSSDLREAMVDVEEQVDEQRKESSLDGEPETDGDVLALVVQEQNSRQVPDDCVRVRERT